MQQCRRNQSALGDVAPGSCHWLVFTRFEVVGRNVCEDALPSQTPAADPLALFGHGNSRKWWSTEGAEPNKPVERVPPDRQVIGSEDAQARWTGSREGCGRAASIGRTPDHQRKQRRTNEYRPASAVTLVARKKQPLLKSGERRVGATSASVIKKILRLFPDFSSPCVRTGEQTSWLSVQCEPWS